MLEPLGVGFHMEPITIFYFINISMIFALVH